MSEPPRRKLTRFEDRLVTITRAVMRLTPADLALPLVFDRLPAPAGLSSSCLELVCDALAHGAVLYLGRHGGWRNDRFLRDGKANQGRLWHRIPIEERAGTFSKHTLAFLLHITSQHPVHTKAWEPPFDQLTPCDQLVVFLTYEAFRHTDASAAWRKRMAFARNPLNRLHFPDDFSVKSPIGFDYSAWVAGLGSAILEVMQPALEERWLAIEHGKRTIGDWVQLQAIARSQDEVLNGLWPALETGQRRDLARFVLRAAGRFCRQPLQPDHLIGGLADGGPNRLAERYAVYKQTAVLPRALERLSAWERQARTVSYLDEGYPAAQFWLQEWEDADADVALNHARQLLQQLAPVRLEAQEPSDEPSLQHSRQ